MFEGWFVVVRLRAVVCVCVCCLLVCVVYLCVVCLFDVFMGLLVFVSVFVCSFACLCV